MQQFGKQDMGENHYNWSDTPVTAFAGEPSRRLFDRFNGDQVLFLINYYGMQTPGFTPEDGRVIEYELFHHLPLEAKSEISVFNWIWGFVMNKTE